MSGPPRPLTGMDNREGCPDFGAEPADLRFPLPLHRKIRGHSSGRVFRLPQTDLDGFQGLQERYTAGAPIEPTTWIRASAKDVKLIQSLGMRESGFLASISDYHVFHKFSRVGDHRPRSLYLDAVQLTLDAGIRPRLHLEDATADRSILSDILSKRFLIRRPVSHRIEPKFRICDTLGLALPDVDVPLPRGLPRLFEACESRLSRPISSSILTMIPA